MKTGPGAAIVARMQILSWHRRNLIKFHSFPRFLWTRFWDDQCFEAAGALAYTTMLAMVPLGAVSLAIISAFPQFQTVKEQLLEFIFTQFVPSAGISIKQYIEPLFDRASSLTIPGVIALMVSAVLMMNSIETTAMTGLRSSKREETTSHLDFCYYAQFYSIKNLYILGCSCRSSCSGFST